MPTVREYRIVMPYSVEEYRIAQLYMVAKFSAKETGGKDGDGVEVLKNEPYKDEFRSGQYTHKIYRLAGKLPSWIAALVPHKALMLEEKAWNAYPWCMTELTSPYFTKLKLQLQTMHVADRGESENAHQCDAETLKKRIVEFIDIGQDSVDVYVEAEDPAKFKSVKTERGPLTPGWSKVCDPVMTAYKLVTVDVPYWGFGPRLEKYISKTAQRKVLLEGNRKAFCWLDEWFGLTMEDIRKMEVETFSKLNQVAEEVKRQGLDGAMPAKTTKDDQAAVLEETAKRELELEAAEQSNGKALAPT
eukprot:TRINITY_DN39258_c0_g1_i1.p1 TRINITY_DN39258_c0_g1~~TRINITY_DN39258_c0_g1_i1.p1  ORF type:complete len:302 (+),score=71.16 TRINITY_DN39258_c0_g1_i1:355-1260(+)